MPTAQIIRFVARPLGLSVARPIARLGEGLGSLRSLLLLWRTRSRDRSDLFRAPRSSRDELSARGMDVEQEIGKPFWRP